MSGEVATAKPGLTRSNRIHLPKALARYSLLIRGEGITRGREALAFIFYLPETH